MTTITSVHTVAVSGEVSRDTRGRNRAIGWIAAFGAGIALWTGIISGVSAVIGSL